MIPASRPSSAAFTIEHASEVLGRALARNGIVSIGRLEPLRAPADNAMLHVPQLGLVARIAVDPSHRPRLAREIATAGWLADRGIPTTRPASDPPTPQLEVSEGRVISWWEYLPSTQSGDLFALGVLLRRLHREPGRPQLLGRLAPFARVEHQIAAAAQVLPGEDINLLERERDRLAQAWESGGWSRAVGSVVHGDAYTGNTLVVDGTTHLLDFEDVAIGPPEWDVASVLGAHRLGWIGTAGYQDFCRGYGADLADAPGMGVLVDLLLFRRCCWFASRANREPAIIEAVRHRISTLTLPHHLKAWRRGGA